MANQTLLYLWKGVLSGRENYFWEKYVAYTWGSIKFIGKLVIGDVIMFRGIKLSPYEELELCEIIFTPTTSLLMLVYSAMILGQSYNGTLNLFESLKEWLDKMKEKDLLEIVSLISKKVVEQVFYIGMYSFAGFFFTRLLNGFARVSTVIIRFLRIKTKTERLYKLNQISLEARNKLIDGLKTDLFKTIEEFAKKEVPSFIKLRLTYVSLFTGFRSLCRFLSNYIPYFEIFFSVENFWFCDIRFILTSIILFISTFLITLNNKPKIFAFIGEKLKESKVVKLLDRISKKFQKVKTAKKVLQFLRFQWLRELSPYIASFILSSVGVVLATILNAIIYYFIKVGLPNKQIFEKLPAIYQEKSGDPESDQFSSYYQRAQEDSFNISQSSQVSDYLNSMPSRKRNNLLMPMIGKIDDCPFPSLENLEKDFPVTLSSYNLDEFENVFVSDANEDITFEKPKANKISIEEQFNY